MVCVWLNSKRARYKHVKYTSSLVECQTSAVTKLMVPEEFSGEIVGRVPNVERDIFCCNLAQTCAMARGVERPLE